MKPDFRLAVASVVAQAIQTGQVRGEGAGIGISEGLFLMVESKEVRVDHVEAILPGATGKVGPLGVGVFLAGGGCVVLM